MSDWHLAEINIGRMRGPIDGEVMAEFVANLDRINALAEAAPGFVWRLTGDGNNATDLQFSDDAMVIPNMSVWRDMDSLAGYVYRSDHRDVMRRRKEWFEHMEVYMALWWVPAGHLPTLAEARKRLDVLAANGPTADAFTFRTPFPAPGAETIKPVLEICE